MYIYAIELRHFRSFDDVWLFPRSDVNVLVGPNNSGKSTILRALTLLLDPASNPRLPETVSRFDFRCMDLNCPIELRAWLKPRPRKGKDSHDVVAFDESDEVVLAFLDKLSHWKVEVWPKGNHLGLPEGHPHKLLPFTIEPMDEPAVVPGHECLLAIRLRATWNEAEEMADTELSIVDETDTELCGLTAKHREMLGLKHIGARRNPLYELSLARRSLLAQTLDEAELTRALRKLLGTLDREKQALLGEASVQNLFSRLNGLIDPRLTTSLLGGAEFTLTFLGGDTWRLRGATSIATTTSPAQESSILSEALPLEYQGDGVQNLLLLLHLLEFVRDNDRNCIVVLEEPEQNLEPALARAVFGGVCSLVQQKVSGPDLKPETPQLPHGRLGQVFVTTHSPALISELRGSESLTVLTESTHGLASRKTEQDGRPPDAANRDEPHRSVQRWHAISICHLPQDCRKKLDQNRDRYASALFARHVLIVEGDSEIGFLPVAFRHLARNKPYRNPYHLGLEVMDGDSKSQLVVHADVLGQYGKVCHLLFDYDGEQEPPNMKDLQSRLCGKAAYVTSWPRRDLLSFAHGCDLEIVLAAQVPPAVLFGAIKRTYDDAGHELKFAEWDAACKKISDPRLVALLPRVCQGGGLSSIDVSVLGAGQAEVDCESVQRAFVYALLHGPHCCKSVKDMRMIAETLSEYDALPPMVESLMDRLLRTLLVPEEEGYAELGLAPGR